jgi:hypothetical protein
MKITINNFGPIQSFSFDLKEDFVLIVGENNIGKSYAISMVYIVLKSLLNTRPPIYFFDDSGAPRLGRMERLESWLKDFETRFSDPTSSIEDAPITEDFEKHLIELFENTFLPNLQESLYGTFSDGSNLNSRYVSEPVKISIVGKNFELCLSIFEGKLQIEKINLGSSEYVVRKVRTNRTILRTNKTTVIYYPTDNPSHFEKNYGDVLLNDYWSFIQEVSDCLLDIHYLPASRSGLYQALSAFGQIVAELAKNRTMLSKKIELPGISEPLSDYFLKLSEIQPAPSSKIAQSYLEIANLIEKEVLKGTVEFDSKSKKIMFNQVGIGLKLDLSATSSMVSEISPIASYIKYVLPRADLIRRRRHGQDDNFDRKQILFIEEPEAHLHPSIQVALMKVLAALVAKTKTKVVMTSHSNYIFNKISNLIIEKTIDREKFRAVLFRATKSGSVTQELVVTEDGIVDENFVDIGESIYQERLDLLNQPDVAKQ